VRKRLLYSLILVVLVGLAFSLFRLLTYREISTLPDDLIAAEARWTAHPIKHYRLTVKYSGYQWAGPVYHECIQDVEVTDEQPGFVFQDTCLPDPYLKYASRWFVDRVTVTGVFAKLKHDATTITFGHDQQCGDLLVVTPTYDAMLGFPTGATYGYQAAAPSNLGFQTYRQLYGVGLRNSDCLANSPATPPTITVTLQALS